MNKEQSFVPQKSKNLKSEFSFLVGSMSRVDAQVLSPCLLETLKSFFGTSIDLLKSEMGLQPK